MGGVSGSRLPPMPTISMADGLRTCSRDITIGGFVEMWLVGLPEMNLGDGS